MVRNFGPSEGASFLLEQAPGDQFGIEKLLAGRRQLHNRMAQKTGVFRKANPRRGGGVARLHLEGLAILEKWDVPNPLRSMNPEL